MRHLQIVIASCLLLLGTLAGGCAGDTAEDVAVASPESTSAGPATTAVFAKPSSNNSCGDKSCMGDETCSSCASDCGACSCGDGTCGADESAASCPDDCHKLCGDGVCDPLEDDVSCPKDCGCSSGCGLLADRPCACGDGCGSSPLGCCYDAFICN